MENPLGLIKSKENCSHCKGKGCNNCRGTGTVIVWRNKNGEKCFEV